MNGTNYYLHFSISRGRMIRSVRHCLYNLSSQSTVASRICNAQERLGILKHLLTCEARWKQTYLLGYGAPNIQKIFLAIISKLFKNYLDKCYYFRPWFYLLYPLFETISYSPSIISFIQSELALTLFETTVCLYHIQSINTIHFPCLYSFKQSLPGKFLVSNNEALPEKLFETIYSDTTHCLKQSKSLSDITIHGLIQFIVWYN